MRRPVRHRQALHRATTSCSRTRTSTPSTSTRRSPTTRRSRSRRSRPASTSPAPCRWRRRSRSAGRSSRRSARAGKVYMMMETVVYSREYLFVKELYDKGELGPIQFLRGSHQQDMDGWPDYWPGLPPMHYATHCVSPCLAILGQARRERRLPRLRPDPRGADPEVRQPVRHRDGDVQDRGTPTSCAEVTRSLFDTARQYRESFDVYGSKKSASSGSRSRTRSRSSTPRHDGEAADRAGDPAAREGARLRPPAAGADPQVHAAGGDPGRRAPVVPPGRRPRRLAPAPGPQLPDGRASASSRRCPTPQTSANWTMVGICAHQSAMKGGEKIQIPRF